MIERISRLQRFHSKLLNLWIVKFYKALIKAKDEAFVMYLIKKNLLTTLVDIFLENEGGKKRNLLHSSILELFDYLTKESNKKIANCLVSEILFNITFRFKTTQSPFSKSQSLSLTSRLSLTSTIPTRFKIISTTTKTTINTSQRMTPTTLDEPSITPLSVKVRELSLSNYL